jgi:hypothetical protein
MLGLRVTLPRMDRSRTAVETTLLLLRPPPYGKAELYPVLAVTAGPRAPEDHTRGNPPARLVNKEALPLLAPSVDVQPSGDREKRAPALDSAWGTGKDLLRRVSRVKLGGWAGPCGRKFHA